MKMWGLQSLVNHYWWPRRRTLPDFVFPAHAAPTIPHSDWRPSQSISYMGTLQDFTPEEENFALHSAKVEKDRWEAGCSSGVVQSPSMREAGGSLSSIIIQSHTDTQTHRHKTYRHTDLPAPSHTHTKHCWWWKLKVFNHSPGPNMTSVCFQMLSS